ncbi:hypothetical protein GIB67_039854 [Kingdonia uniflora]|uniref:SWIM-type domain-containing protein n=1 Tax=Kingdonia uniflora TaxID=39325 RepID=A0A7J7P3L0_9MAGN|nr:hypothetical protein GIB67_039854 [Kingdonia uniflora]
MNGVQLYTIVHFGGDIVRPKLGSIATYVGGSTKLASLRAHSSYKDFVILLEKISEIRREDCKRLSTTKNTGSDRGLSTTKAGVPLRHNSFLDPEPEYRGYLETNDRGLDPHSIYLSNELVLTNVPPSNEPMLTNVPFSIEPKTIIGQTEPSGTSQTTYTKNSLLDTCFDSQVGNKTNIRGNLGSPSPGLVEARVYGRDEDGTPFEELPDYDLVMLYVSKIQGLEGELLRLQSLNNNTHRNDFLDCIDMEDDALCDVEEVEKELEHSSLQDKMDKELQELDKESIGAIQNVEGFTGKGSSPESNIPINTLLKRTMFNSKLAVVLSLMDECFMPTFDRKSVCKTSIPELSQSIEKAIDGLRSRYVYKVKVKPLVGHIVVCRDTKLALDGDEKMGNMVSHDVQDITKEDGTEQAKNLQAHQAGLMEQKTQEGSVNIVNADLPTSEDDTDTDTGYVPDLDRGFYYDIEHYISACATLVKKPRVASRMTITVNEIIRICDQLILTGPYGATAQDHVKYDIIVLIRLGIGATPFISVIKDILCGLQLMICDFIIDEESGDTRCPSKAYFYWVTREQSSFEWFIDVMKEISETTPRQIFWWQIPFILVVTEDPNDFSKEFNIGDLYRYMIELKNHIRAYAVINKFNLEHVLSNEYEIMMRGSFQHAYQLLMSYFAEVRYGVAYTNHVESWNNVILKVIDLPIHVFIEKLYRICSEMSYTYSEEAEKSQARLTPWATDHYCTCFCRWWQTMGIPCEHRVHALGFANVDPTTRVSEYYTNNTYKAVYEPIWIPIRGIEQ